MSTCVTMLLVGGCILLSVILFQKYESYDPIPKTVCHVVDVVTDSPENNTITSSKTETCITETPWNPIRQ